MKRLSIDRKLRELRLRDATAKQTQTRRRRRSGSRLFVLSGGNYINHQKKLKGGTIRIPAPEHFNLINVRRRRKLLRFIQTIRRAANQYQQITIDLGPIKRLHPCGTLLFVAEIDRLLKANSHRCKLRATRPRDPIVEELFQHIGILAQLGVKHRLQISHKRVKNWTFHVGHDVDITSLAPLKDKLDKHLGEDLSFDLLGAMQEAITNAVHHAYIKPRGDGIHADKGWWLFAEYSEDGVVYLSVCDLGIGIRRTLPIIGTWTQHAIESVLQRLGANTNLDAKYIKAAIELGATRTGQNNRGKGLHEMLELVTTAKSGGLRIFSDRGMFTHAGSNGVEKILDYKKSIMGTLIQWSFDTKLLSGQSSKDEQDD